MLHHFPYPLSSATDGHCGVKISDEWADTQIEVDGTHGCLQAFGNLKLEYKHLKVILSVGGGGKGGEHFAQVARDARSRGIFAFTAQQLVVQYGLDGIDSVLLPSIVRIMYSVQGN